MSFNLAYIEATSAPGTFLNVLSPRLKISIDSNLSTFVQNMYTVIFFTRLPPEPTNQIIELSVN